MKAWFGCSFLFLFAAQFVSANEVLDGILKDMRSALADQKLSPQEGQDLNEKLNRFLDSKPPIQDSIKGLEMSYYLSRWMADDARPKQEKSAVTRLLGLRPDFASLDTKAWNALGSFVSQFGVSEPPFGPADAARSFDYLDQIAAGFKHPRVAAMVLAGRLRAAVALDRVGGGLDSKTRKAILDVYRSGSASFNDQVVFEGKKFPEATSRFAFELEHLGVGSTAPALAGTDLDGKAWRLSDLKGKTVVLMAWATWCPDCITALPGEKKLVESFKGQPVTFVGLNGDESREKALKFAKEKNLPWASLWGRGTAEGAKEMPVDAWHIRAWPSYYVIDKAGVIRYKYCWDPKFDELEQAIRAALGSG